jgi:hypothetical protein
MGRPIKSRFFGNRNPGGIGGEKIASITIGGTNDDYTAIPTLTIDAPALPGGITATAQVQSISVASVTIAGTNDDYTAIPTLTIATPALPGGVTATAEVTAMTVATIVGITAAGTGYTVGDTLTLVGGTGTAGTIEVDTVDEGGEILTASLLTGGEYSALPADVAAVAVTGGTGNGATFSLTFAIDAIDVTESGSGYNVIPAITDSESGNATLSLTISLDAIAITEPGRGYTTVPTVADSENGNATLTAVLTAVKDNAILISAFVVGGASAVAGDIVKQTASRRYLVTTTQGTSPCRLVAAAPTAGQMTMTAVDSAGGTYYVIKLTAYRALIVKGDRTGVQFTTGADGISVPWSLNAAVANQRVQIVNA